MPGRGWLPTQGGPWQVSHQTGCKGCSVSGGCRLQRTLRPRQEPTAGLTSASDLQVRQVLQAGEWQRVPHAPEGFWHPLRRAGVRKRESLAGGRGDRGGHPDQPRAQRRLRGWSRVLPLISSETLSQSHLQRLHLCHEGARPAAPRSLAGSPSSASGLTPALLDSLPTPLGLDACRPASSTSSPLSSAPWQPSPPWEW